MTPEDFDAQFDLPFSTVVRIEALPTYSVGGAEQDRIEAWRRGEPRPERSVRTSPWLRRIATTTANGGRSWHRLRVVDQPLSDYQRYQLQGYIESQAAGDQVRIALRSDIAHVADGPDAWLFDGPDGWALVMSYDDEGHWLGVEWTADPRQVREIARRGREIEKRSMSLNEFLAGVQRG